MAFFTDKMGIPAAFAILTEFLGPIALLVAALLVHIHFGFFMNWLGKQKGEGIEFDLLLWAIALALIVQGAGAFSIDRVISARSERLTRTRHAG